MEGIRVLPRQWNNGAAPLYYIFNVSCFIAGEGDERASVPRLMIMTAPRHYTKNFWGEPRVSLYFHKTKQSNMSTVHC